jgi:UDP-glucose 4-epimerase
VFNVGSGVGCTVREVIEADATVSGRTVPTVIGPRRAGDPAVLVASADRIREVLQWSAEEGSIVRIVESAWAWMREHPDEGREPSVGTASTAHPA